ncbi:hypothetical protein HN827_05845 [archaeon]|jgi:hypothetical protein|nr:hypothetical protein [archaeon]MBT6820919.1 hypothetical protein [archaeon]MBT7392327.1 hypothetical protein [archaeon]
MERKDIIFLITFSLALASSIFYLGNSITGNVVQSQFCENGICNDFCRFDSDCNTNSICCNVKDNGVCTSQDSCQEKFIFETDTELDLNMNPPITESPSIFTSFHIGVFITTTILITLIGFLYFINRYIIKH